MKTRIVLVQWKDACYHESIKGLVETWSVGFIYEENDEQLVLASSYDGYGFRWRLTIPKSDIVKITDLGTVEATKKP